MTVKMYGFWRSNAAFRVRVALALKNIAFEEIEIDILSGRQFEPDYAALNAERVVPTLIHGDRQLAQSMAIMEYLDEVYPEPPLLPTTAEDRAYARALALVSVADTHPLVVPRVRKYLGKAFGADAHAIETWCVHWVREGLDTYERMLDRRPASPYALGNAPGLADICIAGHIVMADLNQIDVKAFPQVAALGHRCFELAAFADAHPFRQPGYSSSAN